MFSKEMSGGESGGTRPASLEIYFDAAITRMRLELGVQSIDIDKAAGPPAGRLRCI